MVTDHLKRRPSLCGDARYSGGTQLQQHRAPVFKDTTGKGAVNAGMSQGHKISPLATRRAVKLWQISNRQVMLDSQYGGKLQTLGKLPSSVGKR